MNKIELIDNLITEIGSLQYKDENKRDAIVRKAEMIIRKIFGETSSYLKDLDRIRFWPNWAPSDDIDKHKYWQSGTEEVKNLFSTMKDELLLFEGTKSEIKIETKLNSEEIFVVHGHDDTMKVSVARVIEKLELKPIILHEQPNKGRTVIEKFTDYSKVGFAVIILSPDDIGYSKLEKPENYKFRARQNVVLELGYFLGRLGRDKVIALFREEDIFEIPSDYSGVLFVPFDKNGRWQFDLVKELKAAGYKVDANKLV